MGDENGAIVIGDVWLSDNALVEWRENKGEFGGVELGRSGETGETSMNAEADACCILCTCEADKEYCSSGGDTYVEFCSRVFSMGRGPVIAHIMRKEQYHGFLCILLCQYANLLS